MFVTAQQLEQQMPDATRLLSDEPEMLGIDPDSLT